MRQYSYSFLLSIFSILVIAACARPPQGGGFGTDSGNYSLDGGNVDGSIEGCIGAGGVGQPFGSQQIPATDGVIFPSIGLEQRNTRVRAVYDQWKQRYLKNGCGDGRYYVDVGFQDSITVSEAAGYGMIISAFMAGHDSQAKTYFDGLFRFTRDHPSDGDARLMAWAQDRSCDSHDGKHSATDGDLDIAYALLLADKQWGSDGAISYITEAFRLMDGILQSEVDNNNGYLLLGDWASPHICILFIPIQGMTIGKRFWIQRIHHSRIFSVTILLKQGFLQIL